MRTSSVWGLSAGVVVVAALALGTTAPTDPLPAAGASLGPAPGGPVAPYVAASTAELDRAGGSSPRWALLAPTAELTAPEAAALAAGTRTSRVLLRVPVTAVQTPLLSAEVADQSGTAALAAELADRQRRAGATLAASGGGSDRGSRVDALASARLRDGCTCIVGLLLRGTPDELRAVAARQGVRAVQVAPEGTGYGQLAVSPLLPEQVGTVRPGRDDGAVPAG